MGAVWAFSCLNQIRALLVTGAWSHTVQLGFEALLPNEGTANEGMTTHRSSG